MGLVIKTKKRFSLLSLLLKENNPLQVFRYIIASRLGVKAGKVETLTIHGHRLFLRRGSPDLSVALTSLGGEFDILKYSFDRDFAGLVIDAGGYIGTAAIALAELFPKASIVSIEASSANARLAQLNTASYSNIRVVQAALCPEGAPNQIVLNDRGTGEWGFTIIGKPADRKAHEIEKVETITLGDILKMADFDRAGIVKLDIEGGELQMFQNSGWLDDVEVLIVELHERIVVGCEEAFHKAAKGRHNICGDSEKLISFKHLIPHEQNFRYRKA